ncbi:c-di-AMP phosphodiesterase-like protein [Bacillus oleivorans]|uniref:Cyclic-di-AMP phosphodiesterase n=1 Tax=Bacillus oleivorans TaxID=1448271 RepID=A0A285CGK7_9BACI|nr:DHH family phosphoesterase [Bacillus oleivorans]SNX66724.1 c-di-AMP phosphodiesterase-like protein [Bacillus oleivorans]
MSSHLRKGLIKAPLYALVALTVCLLAVLAYFQWIVALIGFVLFGGIFFFLLYREDTREKEIEQYISTLSHRVKKVGEEALLEMPIGIMLINDEYVIEWANPYLTSSFEEESLIGRSIYDIADDLVPIIKQEIESDNITLHDRKFRVVFKAEERLLYFFDITEQWEIEKRYKEEQPVISIIFLDNYDEMTQGMDDQTKSSLNSQVTSILNKWANDYGIYLKRVSSDRFIAIYHEKVLNRLEADKFSILDVVREMTSKQNVPLTLSIGVGVGVSSLIELGSLAQSSLDLSLGRGGDQVAIKLPNGKVKFYGGKTNPMEKRTRVRARVIAHALKELIAGSDNVFIMGHKRPDMDAIGSAIGILKIVEMNEKAGYVVVNQQEMDTSVSRLMKEVKQKEGLYSRFISPERAMELASENSLLVIVDTHKPSMVISDKLLQMIDHTVVIDHHRRGEEFVHDPLLVYMEPYASSTAELVTELLEYQPRHKRIEMLEATALLAGIIVDTKSFTLRTGSRTFDAASYLRTLGADTILVQRFLKEDIQTYVKRAKLIEHVEFYKDGIAIAKGHENELFDQILIAKAADTLLTMDQVAASFVVAYRQEGMVSISARSLGDVNVQVILERLGGGGHLSNAATQILDVTIEEAVQQLYEAIDEYKQGGSKE